MVSWKHRKADGGIQNIVVRLSDAGGDLVEFGRLIDWFEARFPPIPGTTQSGPDDADAASGD